MAPSLVSPKFLLGSFILFISLYIRQVTARATDVAFAGTPQTCTPITISWANGAPPFQVTISSLDEGQTTGRAVQIIQSGNSRRTQWIPNLPGGTRVFATVSDNQQEFANSNLFTIATSNNQSCLPPGSATPTQNPSPNQRTRISPVVPILLTILTIALIAGIIFHTCRRMRRYTPTAPESKLEWGQGGKEYSPPKNLANMSGWRYRWELFWLTLRRDMILLKNRVGKWGKKGADSAPAQSNGDQDLRTSAEMARTIMDKDVADTTRNNTIISRQPTDLTAPTSPAAGFGPRTTAINFGNEPSPPEPSPLNAAVFTASVVRTEKPAIQQAPAARAIPPPIRVPVRYDSEATPKPLTTPKRIGLPSAGDRLANMRPIKPGRSRSSVAPSVSRRASSVPPKRASTVTGRAPRSPDTSVARSPTLVGSPASPRAPVQVQTLSIKRRSRSVGNLEPSHSNTAPLDIPEDSVSSDQEDNVNPFQDIPFRNSSPSASSFGIPRSPTATEVGLEEGTYFAALPTASTQYRFSRALPDSAHLVPPLTWTATDLVPPFPLPGGSPMMTSRTLPAKRTSVASTVASEALERSRSAAAPSAYKRSRSRSRDARRMKGRSEISRGSTITEAEESSGESVRSRVPPMPKKNVSANRF